MSTNVSIKFPINTIPIKDITKTLSNCKFEIKFVFVYTVCQKKLTEDSNFNTAICFRSYFYFKFYV